MTSAPILPDRNSPQPVPQVLVVMDVDGTMLVNGQALRSEFHRAFLEETGVDISRIRINFAGSTDRYIMRQFVDKSGIEADYEETFQRVAARFCELVEDSYPNHPDPRLLPGVLELLEALHEHPDAGLVLGTGNIRRSCDIKLARFGLEKYFPHGGGFGGDHEIRADAIRAALEAGRRGYGWSGERAWVVGDTPNDAIAGHEAGAKVLLVGTGKVAIEELRETGAEVVLDDLTDTGRVLEILLG